MGGKSPVEASAEQREALTALAGSRDRGEADRACAVLLTLAGWTSPRIAEAFNVREDTVRLWRSDFASGGVAAFGASVAPGPVPVKSSTTGQTIMRDVLTVDATSTILLLMAIEAMYPRMRLVHVFLDNARYHHAKLVQTWLARPGCRIKLHFVPAYCPHLNPIERLWGLMHRHTTHNGCHATFKDFSIAMLTFLREDVPANWRIFCDEVTDNFRVITPTDYQIIV